MTELPTCVAISKQGNHCTKDTYRLAPFPLCFEHAFMVYLSVHGEVTTRLRNIHEGMADSELGPTDQAIAIENAYDEQSVVYYVRIGDYIKIGFTKNLSERLKSLRVDVADVMATEPGGRDKERERHEQFADIRLGRRENFERTPDLLTHIAKVRRENGKPRITGAVVLDSQRHIQRQRPLFKRRIA